MTVKKFVPTPLGYAFFSSDETMATPIQEAVQKTFNPPREKSSLAGEYTLHFPGVAFEIKDNTFFSFTGVCNSHTISVQIDEKGFITGFGPTSSTLKFCENDYDGELLKAIRASVYF